MRKPITEVIKTLTADYLVRLWLVDPADINAGQCENFAQDVIKQVYGGNMYGIEEFQTPTGTFDWPLLAKGWGITPPEGFTAQEIDALNLGGHLWVVQHTTTERGDTSVRHYDCECAEGVDSFFGLPFFKRQLTREIPHGV